MRSVLPRPHGEGDEADDHADVGDPRHDERLVGRPAGLGTLAVVADEQPRAPAHDLPADEHEHEVGGLHEQQHAAREERDGGGELAVAGVVAQVPRGEDLDARARRGRRRTRRGPRAGRRAGAAARQVTGRERADGLDVGGARRGDPLDEGEHGDVGRHPDGDAAASSSLASGEQAGQRGEGRQHDDHPHDPGHERTPSAGSRASARSGRRSPRRARARRRRCGHRRRARGRR